MTIEEAAARLREAGLSVQLGPEGFIGAHACPREPHELLLEQGVTMTWDFGLTIQLIDGDWFLREGQPKPSEVFEDLADAIERGLELFEDFRRGSPPETG